MFSSLYTRQILQRYSPQLPALKSCTFDDLVHELSVTFEFPGEFNHKAFMPFPIELIIDYIRKTHRLYLFKKLPEMEQSILLLLEDYSSHHPLLAILHDFYSAYKINLSLHICEEEQHLLPYIEYLLHAESKGLDAYTFFKQSQRYSLEEFEADHKDDNEKDLQQIREIILMYDPPLTNASPYRILLQQLQNFERDLTVHGLIEDHVLVPRMKVTAHQLQEKYNRILRNN